MNAIQTRSLRMGWLGVQTARDELLCWPCACRTQRHGVMISPEDVLANDRCDECGVVLLTGENPSFVMERCTFEFRRAWADHPLARSRSDGASDKRPRGIRLRKLRWHERLRRWSTLTE